jgi:hypothetical protein
VDFSPSYILVEQPLNATVEATISADAMIFFNLSFLLSSSILSNFVLVIGFGQVLSPPNFEHF